MKHLYVSDSLPADVLGCPTLSRVSGESVRKPSMCSDDVRETRPRSVGITILTTPRIRPVWIHPGLSVVSSSGALEAHILGDVSVATATEEDRASGTGITSGKIFAVRQPGKVTSKTGTKNEEATYQFAERVQTGQQAWWVQGRGEYRKYFLGAERLEMRIHSLL